MALIIKSGRKWKMRKPSKEEIKQDYISNSIIFGDSEFGRSNAWFEIINPLPNDKF